MSSNAHPCAGSSSVEETGHHYPNGGHHIQPRIFHPTHTVQAFHQGKIFYINIRDSVCLWPTLIYWLADFPKLGFIADFLYFSLILLAGNWIEWIEQQSCDGWGAGSRIVPFCIFKRGVRAAKGRVARPISTSTNYQLMEDEGLKGTMVGLWCNCVRDSGASVHYGLPASLPYINQRPVNLESTKTIGPVFIFVSLLLYCSLISLTRSERFVCK